MSIIHVPKTKRYWTGHLKMTESKCQTLFSSTPMFPPLESVCLSHYIHLVFASKDKVMSPMKQSFLTAWLCQGMGYFCLDPLILSVLGDAG